MTRPELSTGEALVGLLEAYGVDAFARDAQAAGVDGVLVVDYPPEECAAFAATLKQANIDPIFLLAPTSTEQRYAEVAQIGSGYIYYVSLKGVTGSGNLDLDEVARRIPLIRAKVGMPVGAGPEVLTLPGEMLAMLVPNWVNSASTKR